MEQSIGTQSLSPHFDAAQETLQLQIHLHKREVHSYPHIRLPLHPQLLLLLKSGAAVGGEATRAPSPSPRSAVTSGQHGTAQQSPAVLEQSALSIGLEPKVCE